MNDSLQQPSEFKPVKSIASDVAIIESQLTVEMRKLAKTYPFAEARENVLDLCNIIDCLEARIKYLEGIIDSIKDKAKSTQITAGGCLVVDVAFLNELGVKYAW